MTIWEYAYLHEFHVHTSFDRETGAKGRYWVVYVVENSEGVRILEGIDSRLAALNSVGSDGWLVQLPAAWRSDRHGRAAELAARTAKNAQVTGGGEGYYMRRSRDSEAS